ncbi:MAG: hypothetical protein R3A12_08520 [Ignavibacteria bacterium]
MLTKRNIFQEKGFTNIDLLDISTELMNQLEYKFKDDPNINLINRDFFSYNPETKYDMIFEQTFFCALDPVLRENYAEKMSELLNPDGRLAGVLFDRDFEFKDLHSAVLKKNTANYSESILI